MPHSYGIRARTRHKFSQPFRGHGMPNLTTYLTPFKRGDSVDIKANASVHRGLPFKYYHGRTGTVWNLTPRGVGVELLKRVRNRYLKKRICVRFEHVKPSRCRENHKLRVKENERLKAEAKKKGEKLPRGALKRKPAQPREARVVKVRRNVETVTPMRYEFVL